MSLRSRLNTVIGNMDSDKYGYEDRLATEEAGLLARRAAGKNHISSTFRGGAVSDVPSQSSEQTFVHQQGRVLPDWYSRRPGAL